MHEMSIAEALREQIEEAARLNNLRRVVEVELETGALRQVIPEVMQAAFEAVTVGTVAAGATLKITEIPAKAECRHCQRSFEPQIANYQCPDCQQTDVLILSGHDILLKTVAGDTV